MIEDKKLELISANCLLCYNAKCDNACPKGFSPSKALMAIRFDNVKNALNYVDKDICSSCEGNCQNACIHFDSKVRIKEAISYLNEKDSDDSNVSLEIDFLGVKCENPFFLSSSVVGATYDMCAKALEMGWGGIVFKTMGFYIANEVSPRFSAIKKDATPFVGFRNLEQISEHTLEENLEVIKKLKKNYPSKVIVASIMGQNEEEWTKLARLAEEAGADMIECNFSCPQMAHEGMGSDVGASAELVRKYSLATTKGTKLPVIAKMTPNILDITIPAKAAIEGNAAGISAINTIKSITGVNLDTMEGDASILGKTSISGYSGKAIKPIALRHVLNIAQAIDYNKYQISGIGGIETWKDAMEYLTLGCRNVQITTAVMQYGYRIIDNLISGSKTYLKEHGYKSLADVVGSAVDNIVPAEELNRETIVFPKFDLNKCIGCGRCYISCYDGGHQAITMKDGFPKVDGSKCVGCHLCRMVCPVEAIGESKRIPKPKR